MTTNIEGFMNVQDDLEDILEFMRKYKAREVDNARKLQPLASWLASVIRRQEKKLSRTGYVLIRAPDHPRAYKDGYVLEHVIIFETVHKCCLLEWANIYHIDGNKQNNDWINLEGMTRSQQTSISHKIDMSDRKCVRCGGGTYTRHRKDRPNASAIWSKYGDGYICNLCYDELHPKKVYPDRKCLRCHRGVQEIPHVQWYKHENGHICRACRDQVRK